MDGERQDEPATNLFVMLVGDTTTSRKSTVKDLARDCYDAVLPVGALADLTSPEGFIEQLAKRSGESSAWFVDELGALLDKLHHAKHMAGLAGVLLQIYDGRDYRYTRHSKRTKAGAEHDEDWIRNPHLSVLGAATPDVFDDLTARDVQSGLLPRFAVVMPTAKPPRRPFYAVGAAGLDVRDRLTGRLHRLLTWALTGPRGVLFAPGALEALDGFAARLEAEAGDLSETGRGMLKRLDAMTLKLGMLVAAGRLETPDREALTVTTADAEAAVTIAARWRQDALAFAKRIGETEFERHVERCLRFIAGRKQQPVPRRLVAQDVHLPKFVLDHVEETLVDRGHLSVRKIEDRGKPTMTLWELLRG